MISILTFTCTYDKITHKNEYLINFKKFLETIYYCIKIKNDKENLKMFIRNV